ncbi:protein shisa-5-like [Haliotis cracherodii]|uniref:protein shisa-5-like n=1 Tax=Haliotis cracherodii TaxID=6455 RepID=UPI0039E934B7
MEVLYCLTGLLLVLLEDVTAEYCLRSGYLSTMYCSNGCCGSSLDRYCCTNVSVIAGVSVGAFFFVVFVIAVIYTCVRSANRPGRVIGVQNVGMGATTVVATTGMSGQQHYGGHVGHMPPPPGYNAYPPPGQAPYHPPPGQAAYPPPPDQAAYPPPPQYNAQPPAYPPK